MRLFREKKKTLLACLEQLEDGALGMARLSATVMD
jgi:hypothetical protein